MKIKIKNREQLIEDFKAFLDTIDFDIDATITKEIIAQYSNEDTHDTSGISLGWRTK